MDLSDFGIKKYDMRFLGRPWLDRLGLFVFWAVFCDTLSAFTFYYYYHIFVIFLGHGGLFYV